MKHTQLLRRTPAVLTYAGPETARVQDRFVVTLVPGRHLRDHLDWIRIALPTIAETRFSDLGLQGIGSHPSLQPVQVYRYRANFYLDMVQRLILFDPNVFQVWGIRQGSASVPMQS